MKVIPECGANTDKRSGLGHGNNPNPRSKNVQIIQSLNKDTRERQSTPANKYSQRYFGATTPRLNMQVRASLYLISLG